MSLRHYWWELRVCGWGYFAEASRRRFLIRVAFLLPKSIVYWAFIRFVNTATNCGSPDITCSEALKRNGDWYAT